MKKAILFYSLITLLYSCGGKQDSSQGNQKAEEKTTQTSDNAQLETLESASDKIIDQTEKLNQELDSLIDNI